MGDKRAAVSAVESASWLLQLLSRVEQVLTSGMFR